MGRTRYAPEDWRYCQAALPRVSRTFALNIRVLRGDLYEATLIAYLWCRILDTVEDAPGVPASLKRTRLEEAAALIRQRFTDPQALRTWIASVKTWEGRPDDIALVHETERVVRCLVALPESMQAAICDSTLTMAVGMGDYAVRQAQALTFLRDESDLENYCYIVAGTVGEMLCALFRAAHPELPEAAFAVMQRHAVSFGLGLQITNITKDFVRDSQRGYCFVPATYVDDAGLSAGGWPGALPPEAVAALVSRLARKAIGHLEDALTFTLAIPRSYFRLRLFCVWPLWMAVASLHNAVRNSDALAGGEVVKIARAEVRRIVSKTMMRAWSNSMLRRDFQAMHSELERLLVPA